MSSTASTYSMTKLCAGIGIAVLTVYWPFYTAIPLLSREKSFGVWFILITLVYGVMMFASSYVEEEHHFWYWITSSWLCWLGVKQYVSVLHPMTPSYSVLKNILALRKKPGYGRRHQLWHR